MDKVLSINERLKDKKRKRNEEFHRKRMETVRRIVQCSSCHLTCAMCGSHMEAPDQCCPPSSSSPALNLCEFCQAEYSDFLDVSKLDKNPEIMWHNKEWIALWSSWENYRDAIRTFGNSKEFRQILEENE